MGEDDDKLLSLIDGCVKGEEKAWNLLVGRYGKVVRGCLAAYFRGRGERIDDVTQQVFIKLWKAGLKDFRGTSRFQFLSYLKLISINEAKTYLRLKVRETRAVSIDQDASSADDVRLVDELVSDGPNPEQSAITKEQTELLANRIHALSLEQQQIFLLKVKGYADREIGKILSIPDGTVASSYSRTIAKLKEET